MKKSKLLNKTLRYYTGCGVLMTLLMVTAFYILAIRLNSSENLNILQLSVLMLLLLFVGLVTGLAIIIRQIHRKLWKPFYQTLSLIEQFNIQQNEAPHFPSTSTREFDQMNHVLETLIDNHLKICKIQKDFAENAAQEMQTPLTVFRSTLDMLLHLPDLAEEQMDIIRTVHEECLRLIRMNNNLLLLAQMDNLQFPDTQPLNLGDIVADSLSSISEQAETANITVETYLIDRTLILHANKLLLESLINNLVTNAIKHNAPNGRILVTLHGNRLDITNTDATGESLDNEMLFCRFGRMNPSAKGSGLGLAIVREICLLYGWQIYYSFAGGMHRFVMTFTDLSDFTKPDRLLSSGLFEK